jgi:hypothetical protein
MYTVHRAMQIYLGIFTVKVHVCKCSMLQNEVINYLFLNEPIAAVVAVRHFLSLHFPAACYLACACHV